MATKLETFLAEKGLTVLQFHDKYLSEHCTYSGFRLIVRGHRVPRPELSARISKATRNAVTHADMMLDSDKVKRQAARTKAKKPAAPKPRKRVRKG